MLLGWLVQHVGNGWIFESIVYPLSEMVPRCDCNALPEESVHPHLPLLGPTGPGVRLILEVPWEQDQSMHVRTFYTLPQYSSTNTSYATQVRTEYAVQYRLNAVDLQHHRLFFWMRDGESTEQEEIPTRDHNTYDDLISS